MRSWDIYLSERYCYSTSFVTSHRKSPNHDPVCGEHLFGAATMQQSEVFWAVFHHIQSCRHEIPINFFGMFGHCWERLGNAPGWGLWPLHPKPLRWQLTLQSKRKCWCYSMLLPTRWIHKNWLLVQAFFSHRQSKKLKLKHKTQAKNSRKKLKLREAFPKKLNNWRKKLNFDLFSRGLYWFCYFY